MTHCTSFVTPNKFLSDQIVCTFLNKQTIYMNCKVYCFQQNIISYSITNDLISFHSYYQTAHLQSHLHSPDSHHSQTPCLLTCLLFIYLYWFIFSVSCMFYIGIICTIIHTTIYLVNQIRFVLSMSFFALSLIATPVLFSHSLATH